MTKPLTLMLLASASMLSAIAKPIHLQATADFLSIEHADTSFYKDTRTRSLAINAANRRLRDKWARAETRFTGETGTYDITITTLLEIDGESMYRLLINGVEAGTYQNPESSEDGVPSQHTWPDITVPAGASITVEAKTHTNGKIPERSGTAWSRAHWRSLTLCTAD